jgi:hypothetical protein
MTDVSNRRITKPVEGWNPPDTNELEKICTLLDQIKCRIHCLKIAYQINSGKEDGRIRRIMANRRKKGHERIRARRQSWR